MDVGHALAATAGHAERLAAVDATCLVTAVQQEALALWRVGPHPAWCDDLGTSELEGLRSRFEGDDPRMVEMRAWGPGFRRESWRRALRRGGTPDTSSAPRWAAVSRIQLVLLILLLFTATAVARGYGAQ